MPTFTALTTLPNKADAEKLGLALEEIQPEPTGVGVFEVEDGSGTFEVGGYFLEHANFVHADPLKTPEHIAPVWYFTPFYAILRAVPSKLGV